jgi:hypothetical protein
MKYYYVVYVDSIGDVVGGETVFVWEGDNV